MLCTDGRCALMLAVANLDWMAKSSTSGSTRPKWGRKLAARRTELGLSLGAIEEATDGVVYTQLLYRLENGRMNPKNLKAHQLSALLAVLQWTPRDWDMLLGQPPTIVGADEEPMDDFGLAGGTVEIPGGLVLVAIVGSANGGRPSSYGLPVRKDFVRGDNTRAYQVEGDSMTGGTEGGIRDGNWVLVDTSLTTPIPGRVFLLEIIGDGMTVKRLRQINNTWVFMSDNPTIAESWRDDQVRIIGQVYGRVDYAEIH